MDFNEFVVRAASKRIKVLTEVATHNKKLLQAEDLTMQEIGYLEGVNSSLEYEIWFLHSLMETERGLIEDINSTEKERDAKLEEQRKKYH